jgi:hypothetical protein
MYWTNIVDKNLGDNLFLLHFFHKYCDFLNKQIACMLSALMCLLWKKWKDIKILTFISVSVWNQSSIDKLKIYIQQQREYARSVML